MEHNELIAVINANAKQFFSRDMTDKEVFKDVMARNSFALEAILEYKLNFAYLSKVLAFYLMNTNDSPAMKNRVQNACLSFMETAQEIKEAAPYLEVLRQSIEDLNK